MRYIPTHIIGDIHLGSNGLFKRIYSRDFATMEAYHTAVLNNITSRITKQSILLFLGDLGYREYFEDFFPKIDCYKILIKGNHDTYSDDTYYKYFDEVYSHPLFYTPRIVFSHIPIPTEQGVLNIHGHTHEIDLDSKDHFNICVERVGYSLVTMKWISKQVMNSPKPSYKFLNEWYRDIQISKTKRDDLVLDEHNRILVKESQDLINRKKLI